MNNRNHPLETLSFSDLTCTSSESEQPDWSKASTTLYAHSSGELPSQFAAVGWQPLHLPGQVVTQPQPSTTVQGLTRRATHIVRGEA
jgi:hypothetical protein